MKGESGAQKTVIVLGAARSGTSVTAGILDILGVDFGNVMSSGYGNPSGYFEDKEIRYLTTEVFKQAGGDLMKPPPLEKILQQKDKVEDKIKKLCLNKSRGKLLWGWKLPSSNLIVEWFLPYVKNPYFIVVLRNPLSVATSLVKFETYKGSQTLTLCEALRLGNYFNKEIIELLKRHPDLPRIFVAYEDLMEEPIKESKKLADFLGVPMTKKERGKIAKLIILREKIQFEKRKFLAKKFLHKLSRFFGKSIRNPINIPYYIYFAIKKRLVK